MHEKNDFALVPKPSTTIQKTEPGAKRVLSNMVSDALRLAKKGSHNGSQRTRPPRIVIMDDEPVILEMLKALIQTWSNNATILAFTDAKLAYQELMCDAPDLFVTDVCHAPPDGSELLRLLTEKKVDYPILVMSGFAKEKDVLPHAGPDLRVTFLAKPFSREIFFWQLLNLVGPSGHVQVQTPQYRNDKS